MISQKVTAFDFQLFLRHCGGERFFGGFYYYRWLEYPLVYQYLNIADGDYYLDVGSGNSIFPLFVLKRKRCFVYIVDNESYVKESIGYYKSIMRQKGFKELFDKRFFVRKNVHKHKLAFPDNYFDKISCISTLEHIKGTGDSLMLQEMERILKRQGTLVITFPFNNGPYIEEKNAQGVGYFQRKYNIAAIHKRLVGVTRLSVEKVIYFGERHIDFGERYAKNTYKKIHWFLPIFSGRLWQICHAYNGPFRNYHEKEIDKEGIGVACVVFKKK